MQVSELVIDQTSQSFPEVQLETKTRKCPYLSRRRCCVHCPPSCVCFGVPEDDSCFKMFFHSKWFLLQQDFCFDHRPFFYLFFFSFLRSEHFFFSFCSFAVVFKVIRFFFSQQTSTKMANTGLLNFYFMI